MKKTDAVEDLTPKRPVLPSRFAADELFESDISTNGVFCQTEWCTARRNPHVLCGDFSGPYVFDHVNRVRSARARELRAERAAQRAETSAP